MRTVPVPTRWLSIVLIASVASCAGPTPDPPPEEVEPVVISRDNLGRTITVEGRAVDAKIGALLEGDGFSLWIADLSRWPEGYWSMGQPGRRVRVTGVLAEDHLLPVFSFDGSDSIDEDEPIPQGIFVPAPPVPEGTPPSERPPAIRPAPESQRHRFLLEGATWEPLED